MSANSGLSTLPLEILTQIFGHLEGRQIARCGGVSSYFKHVIRSSVVLQYLIKLDMFGYIDALGSMDAPPIPATRLNQLEKHIETWNNLDWVETRLPAPPHHYHGFGVLSQGILATLNHNRVYCIQLPRLMQGIPLRTWVLGDFGFPITTIEIDPSNNFLVVLSRTFAQPDVHTVAVHLRTLSGNRPHPSARNDILFSVLVDSEYPMRNSVVRVAGCFLGVTLGIPSELRLEIWDWMIGQKITVLVMGAADDFASGFFDFEFLSVAFIVVTRRRALEVYQILTETPGAPPVHTISFCLPPSGLAEYHSIASISGNSRLSHGVDRGNLLSDRSFSPSPFLLAEDTSYLTVYLWLLGPIDDGTVKAKLHVPLSSLRRSATYGDALAIPWEVWSKDVYVYCDPDLGPEHEMSGGRLVHFEHAWNGDAHCHVTLFDLNRSRAAGASADPWKDYGPLDVIRSGRFGNEIRMERPPPVPVVSRSFSLDGSILTPHLILDDEQ